MDWGRHSCFYAHIKSQPFTLANTSVLGAQNGRDVAARSSYNFGVLDMQPSARRQVTHGHRLTFATKLDWVSQTQEPAST
jgi:hypothetical protein